MSESPGFFKVGDTRGDSGNESVKRLTGNAEELHGDPKTVPKYRNYMNFLTNRELGMTAGVQAEKEFYHMKISHKEEASSSNLSIPFNYDSCEVNFLKGDDTSLFGVWRLSNDRKENSYVMGEINYNMNNEGSATETYVPCQKTIDMCRLSRHIVTVSPNQQSSFIINMSSGHIHFNGKFYCCMSSNTDSAMLGGDGDIAVSSIEGNAFSYCEIAFPAKVCTLSRHEPSGAHLLGLHTGKIFITDFREDSSGYCIKISDKAVNDSVFVNDREVIVTDIDDKLIKVDLRARKISATFFGHKHSVTKRPFSVVDNMLCATGADNVVRIWHDSGGHPIHVYKSTSGHEVRGWLHSDGNKTYLNYFERDTRTVFTI